MVFPQNNTQGFNEQLSVTSGRGHRCLIKLPICPCFVIRRDVIILKCSWTVCFLVTINFYVPESKGKLNTLFHFCKELKALVGNKRYVFSEVVENVIFFYTYQKVSRSHFGNPETFQSQLTIIF